MVGFTKLHSLILDSSIWQEDDGTRIVWITMLAMADQDGVVQASIGGLAHRARVSRDECLKALEVLGGPDPDSRDGTTGERIEKTGGGWLLLNHGNYRNKQTRQQKQSAERVRKHRDRAASADSVPPPANEPVTLVTVGNATTKTAASASASASASEKKKGVPQAEPLADPELEQLRQEWLAVRRERHGLKSLTARSWSGIVSRAEKAGVSMATVLEQLAEHGWQTWKAEYGKTKFGNGKENSKSHHVPQDRHDATLQLGDPKCGCINCKALWRDEGPEARR